MSDFLGGVLAAGLGIVVASAVEAAVTVIGGVVLLSAAALGVAYLLGALTQGGFFALAALSALAGLIVARSLLSVPAKNLLPSP
ncbi:MAG: hypothetical protein ACOYKZ_05330 [Chlamydiia bacterium]